MALGTTEVDLFISAAEPSGDLHGEQLIKALLEKNPRLKISASSGPRMRALPIQSLFRMEDLSVMGFIDVVMSAPKLFLEFFRRKKKILQLNPKAVVFIDYPGLHLKLAASLRKTGYKGKLIHYICPTVWAWKKNRIYEMEKHLDLLLTLFPFEPKCFENTSLKTIYVGHPLTSLAMATDRPRKNLLALFPGSREKEIERNLPLQLAVAEQLKALDPTLEIAISDAKAPREETYRLMQEAKLALATSGTVTLELALHKTPTVVNFAIRKLDCFLARKIFKINLPFYCIVNIILEKEVFPELFGPNLTQENLFLQASLLWTEENARKICQKGCDEVRKSLGLNLAASKAAAEITSLLDF